MIPTKQTILHDPENGLHGNCFSAVLASILHVPIDTIPVFSNDMTWVKDTNEWLRPLGLAYCMVEDLDCFVNAYGIKGLWHEVAGNTNRSKDVIHACVAQDCELVFDPHPDNSGLTKTTDYGFFIALEPWKCATLEADNAAQARRIAELEFLATQDKEVVDRTEARCMELIAENAALKATLANQTQYIPPEVEAEMEALQAKVDALMLEYCPDEMTEAQKENWAKHQRPVDSETKAAIDAAIRARNSAQEGNKPT